MQNVRVAAIAAMAGRQRIIGRKGILPWSNLPADLKHFKDLTEGSIVVMGPATWESIPPQFRPLRNRQSIVVASRGGEFPGARTAHSLTEACGLYDLPGETRTVFIIGGESVYRPAIEHFADELFLTQIDLNIPPEPNDKHFPEYEHLFNLVEEEVVEDSGITLTFQRWVRK